MGSPSRLSLGGWGAEGWGSMLLGQPQSRRGSHLEPEKIWKAFFRVWELCPQGHVGTWIHTCCSLKALPSSCHSPGARPFCASKSPASINRQIICRLRSRPGTSPAFIYNSLLSHCVGTVGSVSPVLWPGT